MTVRIGFPDRWLYLRFPFLDAKQHASIVISLEHDSVKSAVRCILTWFSYPDQNEPCSQSTQVKMSYCPPSWNIEIIVLE